MDILSPLMDSPGPIIEFDHEHDDGKQKIKWQLTLVPGSIVCEPNILP